MREDLLDFERRGRSVGRTFRGLLREEAPDQPVERGRRAFEDVAETGRIVEEGSSEQVLSEPQDDYTKELLTAIPHPPLPVH